MQWWPWMKDEVIGLRKSYYVDLYCRTIFTADLMGIAWTVFEVIEHLLFQLRIKICVTWKVKVNIINKRCILMSETVTVPNLMLTALIVSEESPACEGHTHTHTHTHHTHTHTHTTHVHTHTCAHTHTHTCTHTHHTHARAHTHTHTRLYYELFRSHKDIENKKERNHAMS